MARDDVLLRVFARLLPREFRERVFEPALADLRLGDQSQGPRRRWLARAGFVAECLRLGVPEILWHRGRPTRAGATMLALAALAIAIERVRY